MKFNSAIHLTAVACVLVFSSLARAQSMARYTLGDWQDRDIAETYDHPIYEPGGHFSGDGTDTTMFHWDSYGRVRINRDDKNAPFFGYRVMIADASNDSHIIHSTMDEFDLALGLQIGDLGDWHFSTMLGAGYSSTHPFTNTSGIFGIGHLLAEYPYDEQNSILLSADYEGNGGLFPDTALPGFAFIHKDDNLQFMLGFPMASVHWKPASKWDITAQYTVPFTADVDVEYRLAQHYGLYCDLGNFFQGFVPETGDITSRQFFQMKRAELGMRFIFNPWIDATIGGGWAFDQEYSAGFDVRNMTPLGRITNQPYVAFMIRGRF